MTRILKILFLIFNSRVPQFSKFSLFWNFLILKFKLIGRSNSPIKTRLFGKEIWGLDLSTLQYLYSEIFLKGEYNFKTNTKSPLIIDCGSNIGLGIFFFKILYPNSRIVGFEANPKVFSILEKNVSQFGLEEISVKNLALYDKNSEISFFTGNSEDNLIGSIHGQRGGQYEVKVKAVKLSDYLQSYEEIDLIKMDVEGAEWKILSDLFEANAIRKVRQYLIEVHLNIPGMEEKLSDFLAYFEKSGFTYNVRAENYSPGQFQDVLVHCIRKD